MNHLTLWILLVVAQLSNAAPAGDLPRYEPGVLYLPDKAIALGKQDKILSNSYSHAHTR